MESLSLLHPVDQDPGYLELPVETMHDLGFEMFCSRLSELESERNMIRRTMSRISPKAEVIAYRCDVFEDILKFPKLREELSKLLDRVDFLKTYGSFGKDSDASGIWELMHRLGEMDEYVTCVESIFTCLQQYEISSEGLRSVAAYAKELYEANGFAALKKDIKALRADTSNLKSVTLGINLNDRFEAESVGLVSVNSKYFTKSGMLSNFCDFLSRQDDVKADTEWRENFNYRPVRSEDIVSSLERASLYVTALSGNILAAGMALTNNENNGGDVMRYMDRAADSMLSQIVKKLKNILSRHVSVSTQVIAGLIPELTYYIRWARFVERLQESGAVLCKPQILSTGSREMKAEGIYNLKLAAANLAEYEEAKKNHTTPKREAIVLNDLDFCDERRIYLLTGANRGGKTTITQAVGIAFLLAQGGIFVPANAFAFSPVDQIFTHFPADENKTMDLGRLGEECLRFKEIYEQASADSLFLLNETFSTTSFEEGYYIACDAVRAIRAKGARTIYNTHMHKLALSLEQLNGDGSSDRVESLVAETEDGKRSYKVRIAPPKGLSYAKDIAQKYGVTFEMLTQNG